MSTGETMRFKMVDGREFIGRTYADIVDQMAETKLTTVRSRESYRRATGRRVSEVYNIIVDTSTDRAFVQSLSAAGLMERV